MNKDIVGRKITRIRMSDEYLVLDTGAGEIAYKVDGDCCSHSRFFDFYGVRNLLENGPVTAFEEVDLSPGDPGYRKETWEEGVEEDFDDVVVAYGYRFTVEHPRFGEVSAVMSFRNWSNGYYGGDMHQVAHYTENGLEELTEDKIGS